jgi:hypothetical protein
MLERFTPGPWKVEEHNPYLVLAPAASNRTIAGGGRPEDMQLIAQAPALYVLIKQYLQAHNFPEECPCFECVAARRIVAQIESEES